ncbi:MAG: intein-containing Rv2578c family radical SAM protein [Actinomycetota bacterium]|nr:intein-containing Rv2578c family radical SAM protein [Actinomycetota bacterium]
MEREALFEVARRTFDTPEFRGIEFIEVEAKTVINHVPGNFLPFNWTINPYRGCSHACAYCVSGETPVLMGDGRTKALADVRVGDEIYGTTRRGTYRRYVKTQVLAHWSTVKPAYRVTLEDATELIASGDHRFLSDRGWKHVTGSERGPDQRPHLTVNNKLMGTGGFARQPEETSEYRRGYLCGMIRGDGHLGSYTYPYGEVHRFRLALVDLEGLQRTRRYLSDLGIEGQQFLFQEAVGQRKPVYAIRQSRRRTVESLRRVCEWPRDTSIEWSKGFLAGIFDAEGSYGRGILRISNTDDEILGKIAFCMRRLGFAFRLEETSRPNSLAYVRLLGGVRQALRFFHTVDPAITRKRSIEGQAIKNNAPLRVVSIEPLGVELPMYDITTGTGDFIANGVVSHNCFARVTHTYMDMNAGRDFETKIVVKINAPEVLRRQLARKTWKGEHIAIGTATDPYQRAEGRYRLMRGILSGLVHFRNPFSILTKSTLILRDLDLLLKAARWADVSTALSIGTLDDEAWRRSEPGTPHPRKRMEAVAALNDAGIPCGVLMAPILPGITDDPRKLRDVVKAAIDAGATHVSPILLHLRPGVREEFMPWLAEHYPDLVERYEATYQRPYAPSADRKVIGGTVDGIVRALGGMRPRQTAPRYPSRGQWPLAGRPPRRRRAGPAPAALAAGPQPPAGGHRGRC